MDENSKLQREISMLSKLIFTTTSNGNPNSSLSTNSSLNTSSTRITPTMNHRQPYHNRLQYRGSLRPISNAGSVSYSSGVQQLRNIGILNQNLMGNHIVVNSNSAVAPIRMATGSLSRREKVSQFKVIRNHQKNEIVNKCVSQAADLGLSSPNRVAKNIHVNPNYIGICGDSSSSSIKPSSSSSSVPNIEIIKTQNRGIEQGSNSQSVITTKYKVDRRQKRFNIPQNNSKYRLLTQNSALNSQRIKIVKKYSTRLSSGFSSHVQNSRKSVNRSLNIYNFYYSSKKVNSATTWSSKPTSSYFKSMPLRSEVEKSSSKLTKFQVPKKLIVQIGKNKYIRKNRGMTLKKVKPSNSSVMISIRGSQFITKNRGKSLKRLRKQSFSCSLFNNSSQVPGIRLARRAIVKSKLTLKQRSWKKKQFCIYYNRLGECKKNEEGNCPYIHDRKQLLICTRFVVGKCNVADCKLSHDLKLGQMPACQFFNKSNCSRENCPYPHIKSSPHRKKYVNIEKVSELPEKVNLPNSKRISRKRKPSACVENSAKKINSEEEKQIKARYYEQSPDCQPVVSIIPRRIRNDEEMSKNTANKYVEPGPKEKNPLIDTSSKDTAIVNEDLTVSVSDGSSKSPTRILQRARLMSRVNRLQERVKGKESTAPQFLAFK